MKKKLFILLLFLATISINAQTLFKDSGAWLTLTNNIKISKKLSISHVAQLRTVDFLKKTQAQIFQPGIHFQLHKNIQIGAGYLHFTYFPEGQLHSPIKKYENRFWQNIVLSSEIGTTKLNQRFVFEQRFKDVVVLNSEDEYELNGTSYAQRFRYRLEVVFNVLKIEKLGIILGKLSNETRIRFQNGLSQPDFDQNNFAALLGYDILKNSKIWVGYGRYYYKSSEQQFIANNLLQITLNYNFDLTKTL